MADMVGSSGCWLFVGCWLLVVGGMGALSTLGLRHSLHLSLKVNQAKTKVMPNEAAADIGYTKSSNFYYHMYWYLGAGGRTRSVRHRINLYQG